MMVARRSDPWYWKRGAWEVELTNIVGRSEWRLRHCRRVNLLPYVAAIQYVRAYGVNIGWLAWCLSITYSRQR